MTQSANHIRATKIPVFLIALPLVLTLIGSGCTKSAAHKNTKLSNLPSVTNALKGAKDAGLSVTVEEVRSRIVPMEGNAKPLYDILSRRITERPASPSETKTMQAVYGKTLPTTKSIVDVKKILADRSLIVDLVHRASSKPMCNGEIDYSAGLELDFPEASALRASARINCINAMVAVHDKEDAKVADSLRNAFRSAGHAAHHPGIIGYIVNITLNNLALTNCAKALMLSGERSGVAMGIRDVITAECSSPDLKETLSNEIVLTTETCKHLSTDESSSIKKSPSISGDAEKFVTSGLENLRNFSGIRSLDDNVYLVIHSLTQLSKVANLSYVDEQKVYAKLLEKIGTFPASDRLFADMLVPTYIKAIREDRVTRARRVVVSTAAAILDFKCKHKRLPHSLSELGGNVMDPFVVKDIAYHQTHSGFTIYSVGPTCKFSGGYTNEAPPKSENVFTYPTPSYMKPMN